ncbi:DUF4407 domain-containing protein [Solwaraspora sp. WMMB335]|uniref:DUF4407 domain-containing protein n=1 Tax=Solwaraspora sp. WMMB335 TaxID=3404118 RepID=UPI003B95241F
MKLRYALAWLGGGQPELVSLAPRDAARYNSMGAVLLGTAGMAALSATFALHTAVQLPTATAAVVGLLWGLLILSLDRMLVITMSGQSGFWRAAVAALPRLGLALLIGTVISMPLVLRIFQPEIDSELEVMHAESLTAAQQTLDEQYQDIPSLQQRIAELVPVANGERRASVADDPDVQAARAQVAAARDDYETAAEKARCEFTGECGTGDPGDGPAYQQAKAAADNALARLDAAEAELREVQARAEQVISGANGSAQQQAQQQLDSLQPRLAGRIAERDATQGRLTAAEQDNSGLLARLEALERLSHGRPLMWLAHGALAALFACIELLPVLAKLLSGAKRPSLYDKLVDRRERQTLDTDEVRTDRRQQTIRQRESARSQLDKHRVDLQLEAGKTANEQLVGKQKEIAQRAIDIWGEVASKRSDEELARWYARYAADPPTPIPPAASPAPVPAPTRGDPTSQKGLNGS